MNLLRRLSIRHAWIGLTVGAAFIGPASSPIGLADIYWTLLAGAWMTANGALLSGDPFTAAPHVGGTLLNIQWLADLIFHGLNVLGGLPMVITGTALVVAATFALLLAATIAASDTYDSAASRSGSRMRWAGRTCRRGRRPSRIRSSRCSCWR